MHSMRESLPNVQGVVEFPSDQRPAVMVARGHIAIFYPALIILDLYVCIWALLVSFGYGDTPVTKIMALVCFVVVPMLAVHALLRFMTVSVIVGEDRVVMRQGWPYSGVKTVLLRGIQSARVEFSFFGKLLGIGALVVKTLDGARYCVTDIRAPDRVAACLNEPAERAASEVLRRAA